MSCWRRGLGMSWGEMPLLCNYRFSQKLRGKSMKHSGPFKMMISKFPSLGVTILSSTLILPPDSLNPGKNPSWTDLHRSSVKVKPPATAACLAIRDRYLSTSTHKPVKGRRLMNIQLGRSIMMDFNAGAEPIEHRMYARQGMGLYAQRPITRVVRADKGGRCMGGGIPSIR